MARYTTSVLTRWAPADAFSYIADFRNLAHWDPGVRRVSVVGDGGGVGASYDVELGGLVRPFVLRYEVTEWEPARRVVLRASNWSLVSVDEISVEPAGSSGAVVTYNADLSLAGLLRLADPVLALAFRRIGDRAAAGLRRVLEGEPVPTS